MGIYAPRFKPGKDITYLATTVVVAGQIVELTGDYSAGVPAAAGSTKVLGVALFDAQIGDRFTVSSGGVQRPVADGAIAAGDRVAGSTNGLVKTATTATVGTALAAAVSGAQADIRFDV